MRLYPLLFLFLPVILSAQTKSAFLKFDTEEIYLGKVTHGEKVDSVFRFTNVSDEEVIIELVSTCECTNAKWPTTIIKPGDTGAIPFTFDSNEKDTEEELAIDVFLKNEDTDGNPVVIFLYYTYTY